MRDYDFMSVRPASFLCAVASADRFCYEKSIEAIKRLVASLFFALTYTKPCILF